MKISYNEFEILVYLEKINKKVGIKKISENVGFNIDVIKTIVENLKEKEYIDVDNIITLKGKKVLEPYRVKRAIFLAAGFGSRLVPITINTPKPLVLVNGKMIIETLLDAVVAAGIEEIIIIVGYLSDRFKILKDKYPNIKFVYNKNYNKANNILSAMMVKNYFGNSYVLESDLYLYNPNLIRKYEYRSNFLGFYVNKSDDWCLDVNDGIITKEKVGGRECYQMVGISYYDSKDGLKMKKDIEAVYNLEDGKNRYWEQVMLEYKKDNYKIYLRECNQEDIIEIDTFDELKQIDKSYIV